MLGSCRPTLSRWSDVSCSYIRKNNAISYNTNAQLICTPFEPNSYRHDGTITIYYTLRALSVPKSPSCFLVPSTFIPRQFLPRQYPVFFSFFFFNISGKIIGVVVYVCGWVGWSGMLNCSVNYCLAKYFQTSLENDPCFTNNNV